MAQTARLVIEIDSREAERRTQAVRGGLVELTAKGESASKATKEFGKELDNQKGSLVSYGASIKALAGYMAGIITVNEAVSRADGFTQMAARIRNATDSAEEYNLVQDSLFQSTKSTYRALSEAQEVYLGLAGGMKALKYSTQDTLNVSDSLSFSFVANAARADQAQSAIDAFSKSMAKGKIDADAWISIVTAADNIIADLAKTTGKSEVEIRKLGATGKISLEDLIKTLKETRDQNQELADAMENSLSDGLTTLSNAVTKFLGELNMSTGATNTAAAGLGVLADNIDAVTNVAMIGGAYWLATYIPTVVKTGMAIGGKVKALGMQTTAQYTAIQAERAAAAQELLSAQAKLTNLQATRAQLIEELKLELRRGKSQISTQGAINSEIRMGLLRRQQAAINVELTATENALASAKARTAAASVASMTSGRALLGFMTGPTGLGMTVAGLAASYLLLSNNTKVSTEALEDQKKTVSELVQEYKNLTLEKLISQQDELNRKIKDSKGEVSTAFMSLERLTKIRKSSTQDEINRSFQLKKVIADLRIQANEGYIQTGEILSKLGKMGFNEKEIAKIEKYTTQLENGSKGLKEFERQQMLLSQQTGIYGDKLNENQQKINEQQALINGLSGDYKKLGTEVRREADTLIEQAAAYGLTKEQLVKLQEAREMYNKGTISSIQLASVLNENLNIPKEALDSFGKLAIRTDEVKVKLDNANTSLGKANDENAKLVQKTQGIQSFYQTHIVGAINASKELAGLNEQLQDLQNDRLFDAAFVEDMMKKGFSESHARDLLKSYKDALKLGLDNIDASTVTTLKRTWALEDSIKSITDKRTEALRQQNKELKQQETISKRLVGISGNSGIGTGAHLDVRYGGSLSGQKVSNEHLARLKAADKPLSSYRISSNYGPRKAPTAGASSFHKGIDFAMPVGTPITTNVAVKDVQTAYDPKGGGYYSTVTFEDGVVLKLLHQSPKMQGKVKGGASKGSDKSGVDIQSQIEKQMDAQRALENEVASEVQRIKSNLTVRLEDVDQAGFTPERTAEIKAELQRRADNDIAIAQQALRTKLDDYKEFQKTEAELLKENFDRKKFNAAHDIELSKSEQKQAIELLEQQYQQELGLMQLAQEQRLFQAKLVLLSETEAMQERYRLEREEILKNTKLSIEERQKQITFSKASQEKEMRDKITGAVDNWGGIQADMNGYGDFYRQDQDRFSRLGAAQDLFDSKSAAVDYNEQNGIEDINSKLQAGLLSQQDFEDQKTAIMQAALEQRNIIYDEYSQNAQAIEDKYQQDRLNAQIALGGQMIGSLTSMFGSMFGEQSKAYKVMFAADKAYAIAAAGIAIQQNIAQAAKIGFPQNLPLIAGAIAQGASIISNIRAIKDQGFAKGGYTGKGGKYEVAGSVHKGEIVWSQDDIKRWGGVNLVESMRKSANPEAFLNNNNVSADNIMRRAMMSSNAFMESQKKSNIFNQSGDGQIIYKANQATESSKISTGSDLYHDGKVYFSPNGLVQDRSNLEDVYDFTLGRSARPQAEAMASVQPTAPTINFKIEVVNQVKGATVEAEQLDESTVRLIVKDELKKELPREVPKIVSDQIKEPSSPISRAISTNTTARRNR